MTYNKNDQRDYVYSVENQQTEFLQSKKKKDHRHLSLVCFLYKRCWSVSPSGRLRVRDLSGLGDGGLFVRGFVLAVGRDESGQDVVADAPAVGSLPDDLEGRVVDGVVDVGPDFDGASAGDGEADGELEEEIGAEVDFAADAEAVETLIFALLVLDEDELSVGAALGDGHGTLGRPLVGLLAGPLALRHHHLLAGTAGGSHGGRGRGLHEHAAAAAAAASHAHLQLATGVFAETRFLSHQEAPVSGDFGVQRQFAVHQLLELQDLRGQLRAQLLDFRLGVVQRQRVALVQRVLLGSRASPRARATARSRRASERSPSGAPGIWRGRRLTSSLDSTNSLPER